MSQNAKPTQRLRERLKTKAICPRCRYTLTDLSDIRCPECGFVLAAELIANGKAPPRPIGLWVHRLFGAAALAVLAILMTRYGLAAMKSAPRPPLLAVVPIVVVMLGWLLTEVAHACLSPERKRAVMDLMVGLISIGAFITAWRWL